MTPNFLLMQFQIGIYSKQVTKCKFKISGLLVLDKARERFFLNRPCIRLPVGSNLERILIFGGEKIVYVYLLVHCWRLPKLDPYFRKTFPRRLYLLMSKSVEKPVLCTEAMNQRLTTHASHIPNPKDYNLWLRWKNFSKNPQ